MSAVSSLRRRALVDRPRFDAALRVATDPRFVVSAIAFAAFLAEAVYVLRLSEFFVMPDEMSYVKQALGIWDKHFLLTSSDYAFNSAAQLEPLLLAPIWGLSGGLTAFDLSHLLNAALIASTAVPAYLLARRVLGRRDGAYAVAALSVAIPWLAMSGAIMTEASAYPTFVWAVFAMQKTLEEPSARHDALALLAIALAFFARSQAYLLAVVLAIAVVVHEVGWRRSARGGALAAVRGHAVLYGVLALGALGFAATGLWNSVLGQYAVVQGSLLPPGTWEAGRELLDYVVLGIGILPLVCAVAWVPAALVRPASRAAHAYAVLLTGTVAALILATGSFSVRYTAGPNDRYLFYIAPLLFLGMVALLLDRRPAPWRLLGAGVVAAMLLGAGEYMLTGPSLTSSAAAWHAVLQGHLDVWAPRSGLGHMQTPALAAVAALLLSGGLAYARWLLPVQTVGWVAIALVGLYCVAETNYTLGKIESTQKDVDRSGIVAQRTWLDKAASGQDVALVLALQSDPDTTRALYWDTAFWNKSARRTFAFEDDPNYDQGYTQRFGLLRDSGAITGLDGWRLLARAQEDRRFGIEGARKVAETPAFALYRVPAKLWAPWSMRSLDGTGRTPAGTTTTLTVSPRPDGARTVRLRLVLTTTFQATVPYRYVLSASGGAPVTGTVPAGRTRTPAVDVTLPRTGPARVALRVRGPKLLSPSGTPHGLVVLNVGVRPR